MSVFLRSVPIWLQVHNLDLKYWGTRSLFKIISQLGKLIREDLATKNRDCLQFARVLVEVKLSQSFPSSISFVNEKDEMIRLDIHYEWKPSLCSICKGLGHEDLECRKHQQLKIPEKVKSMWQPKNIAPISEPGGSFGPSTQVKDTIVKAQMQWEGECLWFLMDRILCWNVRGLNKLQKKQEVKNFICNKHLGLVCLLETRIKSPRLGQLYLSLFQGWCITSNLAHHSGGSIVLAWRQESFDVNILSCIAQCIQCFIQPKRRLGFHAAFVYAFNKSIERRILWDSLRSMKRSITGPWIMMGDFNATLHGDERVTVRGHKLGCLDFKACLDFCELSDIKCTGNFFTWNNNQSGDDRVYLN
ncbi:uncharacterized protein LOC133795740 [Humulus lupulus]|uniref:uncharacterized protein LOC133795740 n=1 Tax=Humulus lupulus TaxID=3486 RepID=UPI002B40060C|nr:uncharacterized protein LOC133795740 [Humulus lupulus]